MNLIPFGELTLVEVYDINGNKVAEGNPDDTIESLKKGLYFLRLFSSDECVRQIKYLKK